MYYAGGSQAVIARVVACVAVLALAGGCGGAGSSGETDDPEQRIINGTPREDSFFEVSQLYIARDDTGWALCTGAWIGAQTLLTAAHCVTDSSGRQVRHDAVIVITETPNGLHSQTSTQVIAHPDYSWGDGPPSTAYPGLNLPGYDAAVVRFNDPYPGIPAIVTNRPPERGAMLIIAGFGETEHGELREGSALLGFTPVDDLDPYRIFWRFDGDGESNTCRGDSGGPAYIDFGDGPRLVGITSGGTSVACRPGDIAFESRVDALLEWLFVATGGDIAFDEFSG